MAFDLHYFRNQKLRRKELESDRCLYPVHDDPQLSVSFHRCSRRATKFLDGLGFCGQHVKIVARAETERLASRLRVR